jgi:hypothetical protein
MPRVPKKTSILTARIAPEVKQSLERAADSERRSQASMLEVMVLEWCKRHRIPVGTAPKNAKA